MDMMQSVSIAKLADALCRAQASMKPAKKDAENPFFKSTYADLASVWDAVKEPLSTNGLSVAQMPMPGPEGVVRLRTVMMHTSGEWIGGDLDMKPVKNDPQSIGSCLTYARRYALSAITGVATEDDDANAATQPATATARPVPAPEPSHDVYATNDLSSFTWRLGKWKGTPIDSIDTHYLDWFARNGKMEDHRRAAEIELDRRRAQQPVEFDAMTDEVPEEFRA